MDRKQILEAASESRNHSHAVRLALELRLAAAQYPDVMRDAMADIFDLSAYQAKLERIGMQMMNAAQHLVEYKAMLEEVKDELANLERRLDQLHFAQDQQLLRLPALEPVTTQGVKR